MRERNDARVRSKKLTPSLTSSLSISARSPSSTCEAVAARTGGWAAWPERTWGRASGSHRASIRASWSGSTGLPRKSSMPASRQRSRSASRAEAVIAMIGTRLVALGRADRAGGAVAVEPGHPAVHQHGVDPRSRGPVGLVAAEPVDRLDPVGGDLHRDPEALEVALGDQLVDRVVLHHQDPGARARLLPASAPGEVGAGLAGSAADRVGELAVPDRLGDAGGGPGGHERGAADAGWSRGRPRGPARPGAVRRSWTESSSAGSASVTSTTASVNGSSPASAHRSRAAATSVTTSTRAPQPLSWSVSARAVDGARLDHEHPVLAEVDVRRPAGGVVLGRREPRGEPELAAVAVAALEADPAVHRLHQPGADRQPEAGAAVAAGGGAVGLGEGVEEAVVELAGDADAGVGHGHPQGGAGVVGGLRGDPDRDLALVGELDGVRPEVVDHLPQPHRVAAEHPRHVGLAPRDEREPPLGGGAGEDADGPVEDVAGVDLGGLELQPAGLDLRQVEDVVDDAEQGAAGAAQALGEPQLVLVEGGAEQQLGEPDDPVHRGADLVAHRRQELRLLVRGVHRGVARPGQLGGGLLPQRDLAEQVGGVVHQLARGRVGHGDVGHELDHADDVVVAEHRDGHHAPAGARAPAPAGSRGGGSPAPALRCPGRARAR